MGQSKGIWDQLHLEFQLLILIWQFYILDNFSFKASKCTQPIPFLGNLVWLEICPDGSGRFEIFLLNLKM